MRKILLGIFIAATTSAAFPQATQTAVRGADNAIGYTRNLVVEEGTGTWCGYCPAGIVFMETLKKEYPDVIRIAVHKDDRMAAPSSGALLNLFHNYPQIYVNRALKIMPSEEEDGISKFSSYYKEITEGMAMTEVTDLSIEELSDNQMRIKAAARFAVDTDNADNRYGIAFSLTEDGMGPYLQTNYYAGNRNGPMGGWERKGTAVPMVYDEVLRVYAGGLEGFGEIFPAQIKAEQVYEFETIVDCSDIDSENFFLTALIIDSPTREILNALQISATKSAVRDIYTDDIEIVTEDCYNLSGIRVEKPENGIFIRRTVFTDGSERYTKVYFK